MALASPPVEGENEAPAPGPEVVPVESPAGRSEGASLKPDRLLVVVLEAGFDGGGRGGGFGKVDIWAKPTEENKPEAARKPSNLVLFIFDLELIIEAQRGLILLIIQRAPIGTLDHILIVSVKSRMLGQCKTKIQARPETI